ncbi:hypothetical protein [Leptospira alexanderi]|uniref:hypothetical protein n=1 Tax=Leptospira alexanderi TaxID=100053 RepID=UPI000990A197|nr:hypothetical protein [Leptospira alexanderi]
MSNFSSIGYPVKSEQEIVKIAERVYKDSKIIPTSKGNYAYHSDKSNAELWLQIQDNEFVGLNPHYNGKSLRKVCLTSSITFPDRQMDGSYYCWADPSEPNDPESGAYPFVFDVPNFLETEISIFPYDVNIQLSAFAGEIELFDSEEDFYNNQKDGVKFASKFFTPSGLFSSDENAEDSAYGMFAGIIKEFDLLKNKISGEKYYWFLVETFGGEVDVVTDKNLIQKRPKRNGILQGNFWLSGKLVC